MPFEPIKNPFGGVDEQATIDAAADLCGGKHKLEQLSRIFKQASSDKAFVAYVRGNGFTLEQAEAFLVLTKVA